MTRNEAEWARWARERRAAFQTVPLVEVVRGERVQVGFSLTLYVAAPLESAPGPPRMEAVGKLWDELKLLAEDIAPEEERTARVQLEQAARVVLRPENEFKPEVGLTFHLFPRGGSLAAVTDADREGMSRLERRLLAFGVKQGRA
ncbi:MAG TPA: hypothetical protein VLF95_09030 [Vicinamibacteria bacterium]|nr:hypothetical protein [Vicinamibacteria bacterium]